MSKNPPKNESELMNRALRLAGKTIRELSTPFFEPLPSSHKQSKGYIGKLIEWHLGADNDNLPQPDFSHLGIELKTLPVTTKGLAKESTYVCTAPSYCFSSNTHNFNQSFSESFSNSNSSSHPNFSYSDLIKAHPMNKNNIDTHWENSRVKQKLNKVLWIPFEADQLISFAERRIGSPLLWQLVNYPEIENILKNDWEELTTLLQLGRVETINAKLGKYLQIRPKAAHSKILTKTYNHENEEIYMNPKGFYLRTLFTNQILAQNYAFI